MPPAPREPIGRERAGASRGPRRQARPSDRPVRPDFPLDAEVDIPVRVRKEIDRLVHERARANEVKLALSLGTEASEADDHTTARRFLAWAKHLAPRSPAVRESLAIALYRSGDLHAALSELQAYRRISGSEDQNHLLADCLRAEGRDPERAIEIGNLLVAAHDEDIERRVEAAIVVAAVHLDLDRPARARSTIAPFLEDSLSAEVPTGSLVRLLWVSADIAEADGFVTAAIESLERLRSLDATYPDVDDRLDRLRKHSGR